MNAAGSSGLARLGSALVTLALVGCGGLSSAGAGGSPDASADGRASKPDASDAGPEGPCGAACNASGWCAVAPTPTANQLTAVWTDGPNDVWLGAGFSVLHWDGSTWTNIDQGGDDTRTQALWGTGSTDVWSSTFGLGAPAAIRHWNGKAWSVSWSSGKGIGYPTVVGFWGSASNDVWAVGSGGWVTPGAILHFDGTTWSTITSVGGSPLSQMYGVWGSGPKDVWAVGGEDSTGSAVTLHWDGTSWASIANPASGWLSAVWGTASGDVWAVGQTGRAGFGQAFHWDGARWSSIDGVAIFQIIPLALWGSSSNDVWAVGSSGPWKMPVKGIAHWNGTEWSSVASPSPATNTLWAVAGSSSTDVWVVGDYGTLLHSDRTGALSSATSSPLPSLTDFGAVWGTGARDVWVAASQTEAHPMGSSLRYEFAHWNGTGWSTFPLHRKQSSSDLSVGAIWGSGPSDVWAAADSFLHWDGVRWAVSAPLPRGYLDQTGNSAPQSMWGSGPHDIWAVNGSAAALHWDGSAWKSWESKASTKGSGVWGSSADDVWIVGGQGPGSTVVRWDGKDWALSMATPDWLVGVWGSGKGDVWVAGGTAGRTSATPVVVVHHWNGVRWSRQLTGLSFYQVGPAGIFGNGPNDVWIVGGTRALHWDGSTWSAVDSGEYEMWSIWGSGDGFFAVGGGQQGSGLLCHR